MDKLTRTMDNPDIRPSYKQFSQDRARRTKNDFEKFTYDQTISHDTRSQMTNNTRELPEVSFHFLLKFKNIPDRVTFFSLVIQFENC